ncbi:MAG: ATP-binding cassette domain-containing protein [Acidimicrobiia bacterium]|nr:ATP-binding cassette domain-containing protein [Acidimicrobiia bacterium]
MSAQQRALAVASRLVPPAALGLFVYWLLAVHGDNRKWMSAAATALITAGAASGVNLLVGYTGLLTLGHATFLVVGGYAGSVWAIELGLDPWLGFPFAFLFGAAAGVVLALLSCHLRGFYLTVVTLSLGLLMPALMRIYEDLFGGQQGRRVEESIEVTDLPLAEGSRQRGLVVLAAMILFVVLIVCRNLVRGRWGRAWTAIRDSEIAARASGVNTYWYKVAAFGVSSGLVAMVGVVAANQFRIVSNELGPQALSFRLVVICVLGGLGTIAGPVISSLAITFVLATALVQDTFGDYLGIFFGTLAIIGIVGTPGGQAEIVSRVVRRLNLVPSRPPVESGDLRVERGAPAEGTVLELSGLTKRFGGISAVDAIDLKVEAGTIHGLIGPNGSGKTTLINVVSGFYPASGGTIRLQGRSVESLRADRRVRLGLARTFQNIQIWRDMTVLANVKVGAHRHTRSSLLRSLLGLDFFEERRISHRAWSLLRFVGLDGKADHKAGSLPFADQRRLEIARALAADPVLLLLDEPGAGLHPAEQGELVELIREIKARGVTVLLIEHHMDIVMELSDRVTVIDYGRKIAEGTPEEVQADRGVIHAYLGHGPDAVTSRPRQPVDAEPPAPLLKVEDLEVTYGAAHALQGVSFEVGEGEVVAIIGGNGAGKTTTLKTVSGIAESYKSVRGHIWFEGNPIERKAAHKIALAGIVHVPEGRRVFPAMSVEENLFLGGYRRRRGADLRSGVEEVFERFRILGERRDQQAGLLSGGEQQMLAMGRALMAHPKLLLLDEPSLGLAPKIVEDVFEIIEAMAREGTTIVLVEQLASQALSIADRAYVLESGRVTLGGTSDDLRNDPAVVAAYLGG